MTTDIAGVRPLVTDGPRWLAFKIYQGPPPSAPHFNWYEYFVSLPYVFIFSYIYIHKQLLVLFHRFLNYLKYCMYSSADFNIITGKFIHMNISHFCSLIHLFWHLFIFIYLLSRKQKVNFLCIFIFSIKTILL